jgi:hypothetical protein
MPTRCLTSNTALPPATVGTVTDAAAAQHLQWSMHGWSAIKVAFTEVRSKALSIH